MLYLSGTDVSLIMHADGTRQPCDNIVSQFGALGTGGTWSTTQTGANYPGQARLVCQYADAHAQTFLTVNDAGGASYGSSLCANLAGGHGWFALR